MKWFLKAKHWQFFTLLIIIPFTAEVLISGFTSTEQISLVMSITFPALMFVCVTIIFGWLWTVTTTLNEKLSDNLKMNTTKFRIFIIIPTVYLFFLSGTIGLAINSIAIIDKHIIFLAAFIVPLHLLSMVCIIYCLYFCAKTLKKTELKRDVSFSDYAGDFFLIWFFPVGIWIIQPRLNRIAEGLV